MILEGMKQQLPSVFLGVDPHLSKEKVSLELVGWTWTDHGCEWDWGLSNGYDGRRGEFIGTVRANKRF